MAIIKKYEAEVVSITSKVADIYTVELKSTGTAFKYMPGQFLHFALDLYDPSEGWPESRCFSIQSSPKNETLKITYAVKGNFTKRMSEELTEGKVVSLKLPYGELFQQPHNKNNTVFIAGGTGITPFLSLFTDVSFAEYQNPRLYFGFRCSDHDLYDKEINSALNSNPDFTIVKINQQESGLIDIQKILEENKNAETFFISGPLPMIKIFKENLINSGVLPFNIKTDEWE